MVAALVLIRFPLNWSGLFASIAMGGICYIVSAFILNVGQIRSLGSAVIANRMRRRVPALTD